jgi:hypothetical protein
LSEPQSQLFFFVYDDGLLDFHLLKSFIGLLNKNGIDCNDYLDLGPAAVKRVEYYQRVLQEEQAQEQGLPQNYHNRLSGTDVGSSIPQELHAPRRITHQPLEIVPSPIPPIHPRNTSIFQQPHLPQRASICGPPELCPPLFEMNSINASALNKIITRISGDCEAKLP